MKTEKFQLRGNKSVRAGALQLLYGRAPAQLRGHNASYRNVQYTNQLSSLKIYLTKTSIQK
jgi:hypothetical protein